MKSSIRNLRRFIVFIATFVLIIGSVVGLFELINYIGNGANPTVVSGASSSSIENAVSALMSQGMRNGATSNTLPSTTTVDASSSASSVGAVSRRATPASRAPVRPTPIHSAYDPAPSTPPHPRDPSINLLASIASVIGNIISVQTNNFMSATTTVAPTTTTTAVIGTAATSTASSTSASPTASQTTTSPVRAAASSAQTVNGPLPLPYSVNGFSDMAGWEKSWGAVVATPDGKLAIGANSSTTGGEAFLPHSDAWTNYIFTAALDWPSGQTFSLIARYHEGQGNVSCEYENSGEVSIYSTVNGARILLGMGMMPAFTQTAPVTAWIKVDNDRVQCGLNSAVVEDYHYYGLPPFLMSGGIDIETWDPTPGTAHIFVKNISVTPL